MDYQKRIQLCLKTDALNHWLNDRVAKLHFLAQHYRSFISCLTLELVFYIHKFFLFILPSSEFCWWIFLRNCCLKMVCRESAYLPTQKYWTWKIVLSLQLFLKSHWATRWLSKLRLAVFSSHPQKEICQSWKSCRLIWTTNDGLSRTRKVEAMNDWWKNQATTSKNLPCHTVPAFSGRSYVIFHFSNQNEFAWPTILAFQNSQKVNFRYPVIQSMNQCIGFLSRVGCVFDNQSIKR